MGGIEGGKIIEKANSNDSQATEKDIGNKKVEKKAESDKHQIELSQKETFNRLTKEEAESQSEVDEKARETLKDLEEIMTAFKKHKDDPEFDNLRVAYNDVTNLIMRVYNNDVDDLVNNRDGGNKEGMENKDNTEFQVAETEENTGDSVENYFNNKASAEKKAQEILNPQPEEVLRWIGNTKEVLKNGSPENKRILTETIKNAEEETAKLYNKIPRLEKNKN